MLYRMAIKEFLLGLKRDTRESIIKPSDAIRTISSKTDLSHGLKVFVAMSVFTLLILSVFAFFKGLVLIPVDIAFNNLSFWNSVSRLISPIALIIAIPFIIVVGFVFSIILNGIVWFVGKLLGGKSEFGKFYGTIIYVQTGLWLLFVVMSSLIALFLSIIKSVSAIFVLLNITSIKSFAIIIFDLISKIDPVIFSLISLIFSIVYLYYSVIFIKGLHDISTIRVILTILIPVVAMVAFIAIFIIILIVVGISILQPMTPF